MYSGSRTFEDLKSFAQANLDPRCSPKYMELCDGDNETKAEIEALQALSDTELDSKIEEKKRLVTEAIELFDQKDSELKEHHDKKKAEKDAIVKHIREDKHKGGLGLTLANIVQAWKKSGSPMGRGKKPLLLADTGTGTGTGAQEAGTCSPPNSDSSSKDMDELKQKLEVCNEQLQWAHKETAHMGQQILDLKTKLAASIAAGKEYMTAND
jgi:hypothetical protein